MKKLSVSLTFSLIILLQAFCQTSVATTTIQTDIVNKSEDNMETIKIKIKVGSKTFTATLLNNKTTDAFIEMLPLTIKMADHLRNEKHVDLSESIPTNSSNPGTIRNGDLMLFGSKTLVLFYKSFSTSYSYTKFGKVENPNSLATAVGPGSVTVTFELE